MPLPPLRPQRLLGLELCPPLLSEMKAGGPTFSGATLGGDGVSLSFSEKAPR